MNSNSLCIFDCSVFNWYTWKLFFELFVKICSSLWFLNVDVYVTVWRLYPGAYTHDAKKAWSCILWTSKKCRPGTTKSMLQHMLRCTFCSLVHGHHTEKSLLMYSRSVVYIQPCLIKLFTVVNLSSFHEKRLLMVSQSRKLYQIRRWRFRRWFWTTIQPDFFENFGNFTFKGKFETLGWMDSRSVPTSAELPNGRIDTVGPLLIRNQVCVDNFVLISEFPYKRSKVK